MFKINRVTKFLKYQWPPEPEAVGSNPVLPEISSFYYCMDCLDKWKLEGDISV